MFSNTIFQSTFFSHAVLNIIVSCVSFVILSTPAVFSIGDLRVSMAIVTAFSGEKWSKNLEFLLGTPGKPGNPTLHYKEKAMTLANTPQMSPITKARSQ